MIKSMTGFGSCDLDARTAFISVEVHSVNHRHFHIKSRMPLFCQALASDIEKLIRGVLARGTVMCHLVVRPHGETLRYVIDRDVLRGYVRQLREVPDLPGGGDNVSLPALLPLPGVVVEQTPDSAFVRELWTELEKAFCAALDELVTMEPEEEIPLVFKSWELWLQDAGICDSLKDIDFIEIHAFGCQPKTPNPLVDPEGYVAEQERLRTAYREAYGRFFREKCPGNGVPARFTVHVVDVPDRAASYEFYGTALYQRNPRP